MMDCWADCLILWRLGRQISALHTGSLASDQIKQNNTQRVCSILSPVRFLFHVYDTPIRHDIELQSRNN